jgi:hypothetical protein
MAIFNPSNQLLQIDTGVASTYLYNPSLGFAPWAGLGENQVLGQRYVASISPTAVNPSGTPAIYMLVKYLSTSAISTANLTTAAAPAPVYWTDNTFTTVTGISTEGFTTSPLAFPAGYMILNTVTGVGNAGTALTSAMLVGAQILIQIGGYLKGAYAPTAGSVGIGAWIEGAAGTLLTTAVAAASSATYQPFGRQMTVIASGLCDVLVGTDNF